MIRRSLASVLAVAIVLLVSACGVSPPASTTAAPAPGARATSATQQTAPPAVTEVAPTATPAPDVLAPELAGLPVPSGFTLVQDNLSRVAIGGEFSRAEASWTGSLSVADTAAFYRQALAKDYVVETAEDSDDDDASTLLVCQNVEDKALRLTVSIWDDGVGTQVDVELAKEGL